MTAALSKSRYTPEDLLTLPDMDGFELVGGELVEKKMGAESSWIAGQVFGRLFIFNSQAQVGHVFPSETSYRCYPEDPDRVRRPDVSFITLGKLPGERIPIGHIRTVPDLAAEVVSPNDLYSEVRGKIAEYQRAGVRLIWVIDPNTRTIEVRRQGATTAETLTVDDDLAGGEVLPGFRCRVADLFPPTPADPQPEGAAPEKPV